MADVPDTFAGRIVATKTGALGADGAVAAGGTPLAGEEVKVAVIAGASFEDVAATANGTGTVAGTEASDDSDFDCTDTGCPTMSVCTLTVEDDPLAAAAAGSAPCGLPT